MADSAFLTRVVLKNYKSSAACAVRLHPLVFLVGRNGAGKSNFLDALRFVADALRTSLDHAVRDRGGINEVRRRSGGHPNTFGIRLEFRLRSGTTGLYAFRIAARPHGRYAVQEEECELRGSGILDRKEVRSFRVQDARLTLSPSITPAPVAVDDRLYLVNAAGIPDFKPVWDALSHMGFYNLNPDRIRELQSPDPGELLARDGSNIASVLARLEREDPEAKRRY